LCGRRKDLLFTKNNESVRIREMSKEKKAQIIDDLEQVFSRCSIGILTDYRGLSAPEMTGLRRRLRESGVEYRVMKNTLARLAARKAGIEELPSLFEGPVAVAFGYGDITKSAKTLADYIQTTKSTMSVKGGFLPGRLLTSNDIITLSTLPTKEVLVARILAEMQKPILSLVSYLNAPMRGIIGVLQARIQQLEEG
jgi:large subunit ribosomal protein L10